MSPATSYRQILRSSSIIGGASVANILVGLLRMKVAAVLLGPAGVGLIGLMQSVLQTASAMASGGLAMAGTRVIAEADGRGDALATTRARRALAWGTLAFAIVGGAVFWWLREPVARGVFDGDVGADAVGWLALGVALAVAAGGQAGQLNGLRRIGDIARVNLWSALLSTAAGIGALVAWGEAGIVAFVLAAPVATWLAGHWYVRRLPPPGRDPGAARALPAQWRALLPMGLSLLGAGLAGLLGQLLVRTFVQRELGADALGQFQAAWLVSMTYIGFVLGAMATDYYPRLSASIHAHADANRLVNEQAEVALLLATPAFLALLALAPWVVRVLYSGEFGGAIELLRWQVIGDVLKVLAWPLSFVLLAAGAGRWYLGVEVLAAAVFAGASWLLLPRIGLVGTGAAFVLMYAAYLPAVHVLARRRTGFRWDRHVVRHGLAALACAVAVAGLAAWREPVAAATGLVLAALFGAHAARRLAHRLRPGAAPGTEATP